MNTTPIPGARRSAGFTLVEVMVAATVLAIGLLGGGASLLAALRASHEAQLRTRAAALASDLLERVRANAGAASGYALGFDEDAAAAGAPCMVETPCSPEGWAAHDLHDWQRAVRASLPAARTAVSVEATVEGATRCTVTLHWSTPGSDGPAALELSTEA